MTFLASQGHLQPVEALSVGDHADVLVFVFQNRPLFDMQFKERMHFTRTDFFVSQITDACKFITELQATGIFTVVGPVQSMYAGEHA